MSQVAYMQVLRVRPSTAPLAWIALFSAALGAGASGCDSAKPEREWKPSDHGQPQQPDPSQAAPRANDEQPVSAEEAQARAVVALWNVTCSSCHGRDGRGGGGGLPPGARVPDLSDATAMSSKTDAQLAAVIRDGRGMMPAFGPQVGGDSGVNALVAHVRKLAAKK